MATFDHGYALLIGVGDVANENSLSMKETVADMEALRDVLIDSDLCAYPADNDHVRLLHDDTATRERILAELCWLQDCAANDQAATVWVCFAGHGIRDEDHAGPDKPYYLITHDYFSRNKAATAISSQEFTAAINAIDARRMIVIIDCCRAGGMAKTDDAATGIRVLTNEHPPTSALEALARGSGRAILMSSSAQEYSYIRGDSKMSIFTHHLVEALMGAGNVQGDDDVRISNLMNYLGKSVPLSAQADWKASQTPYHDFKTEDFSVALLQGGQGLPNGWTAVADGAQVRIDQLVATYYVDIGDVQNSIVQLGHDNVALNINIEQLNITPTVDGITQFADAILDMLRGVIPQSAGTPAPDLGAQFALLIALQKVDLQEAELREIYIRCLDGKPAAAVDRSGMVAHLSEYGIQGGKNNLPVLDFARLVHDASTDSRTRKLLAGWISMVEQSFPEAQRSTVTVGEPLAYTVVELWPHPNNRDNPKDRKYQLAVTLFRDDTKQWTPWLSDEQYRSLDEIQSTLESKIDAAMVGDTGAGTIRRVYEFIVPLELMLTGFDQWQQSDDPWLPITYGEATPVTLRFFERVNSQLVMKRKAAEQMRFRWERRWQTFRFEGKQRTFDELVWFDAGNDSYQSIFDSLWPEIDQPTACVAFENSVADAEALRALVITGVPVAVWARHDAASGSQNLRTFFDESKSDSDAAAEAKRWSSLRDWVWQKRVKADNHPVAHAGSCMALLWDSPERMPPQHPLYGVQSA